MSKIGKQPIELSEKVEVSKDANAVVVKGPKGTLSLIIPRGVDVEVKDKTIFVTVKKSDIRSMSLHGTIRAILANNVKGVTEGWDKKLELVGTGYRAEVQGTTLVLTVGYINPVKVVAPSGITFKVEKSDITIEGADRELVGEVAAKVRAVRPPEPYQGKGIRYKDEIIKKKPGKAAKAAGAE